MLVFDVTLAFEELVQTNCSSSQINSELDVIWSLP